MRITMLGASLNQNGGIATLEKLILKHISSDIRIQHITTHDEGSLLHRVVVFAQAIAALLKKLLLGEADLVHIHLSDGGSVLRKAVLALIVSLYHKPVLMHAHGAEFHSTYFELPQWARKFLSFAFCQCEGFIVLSQSWKDFYVLNLGLNEKQVFVLPNPTELPTKIPHRVNNSEVNLVFSGRIGQRKGAFDLIKAFSKLPTELKSRSKLTLAGDGELSKGQELVQSLNLAERITFLGWIDAVARDELLAKADIFVLPSYNEGLPMAILEAMGWGLPVLTTSVGGIPELVISMNNGLLIDPGDIQKLAEALKSLIEDEALRLSLGSAARQSVESFDVSIYCDRLADIYQSISHDTPVLSTNWQSKF